jgi:hypothetical protein
MIKAQGSLHLPGSESEAISLADGTSKCKIHLDKSQGRHALDVNYYFVISTEIVLHS